jgi:hypothetical protein
MEGWLASFSISKLRPWRAVTTAAEDELRFRGWRGGRISTHRAFARLHPTAGDMLGSGVLLIGFSLAWIRLIPSVTHLWARMFSFWAVHLNLHAPVDIVPQHWGRIALSIPYINLPAGPITPLTWSLTALVTAAIGASTEFFGEERTPITYMVRALVFLQATALVYFAFASARFPHSLPGYTVGMMVFGIILISLVPAILAFTFYVFKFVWWKKVGLTVATMAHLTLLIPLQYALHICVLHHSILFMPLLYFAFGPFLDVLVFVSLYSWGMSWRSPHDGTT